jgi:hypothetical protein
MGVEIKRFVDSVELFDRPGPGRRICPPDSEPPSPRSISAPTKPRLDATRRVRPRRRRSCRASGQARSLPLIDGLGRCRARAGAAVGRIGRTSVVEGSLRRLLRTCIQRSMATSRMRHPPRPCVSWDASRSPAWIARITVLGLSCTNSATWSTVRIRALAATDRRASSSWFMVVSPDDRGRQGAATSATPA